MVILYKGTPDQATSIRSRRVLATAKGDAFSSQLRQCRTA